MKNNFLLKFILGCLMAPFFIACSSNVTEKESCSTISVSEINPNGDSELALLMRKMYVDADSLKQLIALGKGSISDEFILELERVHNAIPTDENVKTPEFEAFNTLLINEAKALQASTNNQTEGFNQLVNRCLDCHNSFCPGPIKKIKKLKIPTH